jgi:hypothetical protein
MPCEDLASGTSVRYTHSMRQSRKVQRVEDPERLRRFLERLEGADWRSGRGDALNSAFVALNDLIYHEVLFYYRARKKQRWFSILTRGAAVLLGTVGVMVPLLAGANPAYFGFAAPYGYPILVAAAAILVINRMFGATGGHIRYVTAQLELERIITKFRLAWIELLSRESTGEDASSKNDEPFQLMNTFVDQAYRVIQEETTVWGKSVSEALQEYETRLPAKPSVSELAPPSVS